MQHTLPDALDEQRAMQAHGAPAWAKGICGVRAQGQEAYQWRGEGECKRIAFLRGRKAYVLDERRAMHADGAPACTDAGKAPVALQAEMKPQDMQSALGQEGCVAGCGHLGAGQMPGPALATLS